MRTTWILASLSAFALIACGDDGGGGGGGGEDAANTEVDAPGSQVDAPNTSQDAPPMGEKQIGSRCTPDQMNPQGDCPTGFVCLNLNGGSHPWCSKECTEGAGDTCAMGYTGTGKPQCYLTVQGPSGPSMKVCGVICDDLTPMDSICPASQCTGACPASLMCTANLTDANMQVLAKGCQ